MLLHALAYLSGVFGHARSPEALAAGLPVDADDVSPQVFCQAAERAGYRARVVKRKLSDIPAEVMPAVAVMKNRGALVLLQRGEKGVLRVADPVTRAERAATARELEKEYSGYAIFVRPDETAEGSDTPVSRHWLWSVARENAGVYIRVLVASFFINCFALASPVFIMNFYNRVLPNDAVETGWVLATGVTLVFVFDFIIRGLRAYFIDLAGRRSDVIVGQRLFDQVLDMRLGLRPGSTGVFANSMREFDSLREFFNSATMTALVDLPFAFVFFAAIWVMGGPEVTLALAALFVFAIVASFLIQLPVQRRVRQAMKTAEQKHGLLVETIANIETIRGVAGEGPLRAAYARYTGQAAAAGQVSRFYSGMSVHLSVFVQQFSAVVIVIIGMYLVQDKQMSVGALIACVLLAGRAIAPVAQISGLVNRWHQAKSAYRTLDATMRIPVERPRDKKFLHRPLMRGNFSLQDVAFAYPQTQRAVLHKINAAIREGEKVAIVGRIGSGKSTLIKLLVGFHEASAGTILADDTDLRQIDPADLRRNIAYMGQDTSLMSGTVRDNIVMGRPDATDAEVLKVAELAGAHEFIRHHPMGYDAPVGERGEGLSGGQRQSIALARTLLMDTPVLVLDEPTNAMDSASEERVLRNLEMYARDKTLILVTHKPALLRLVSRVIVMDNGTIAMDGPRDQVIAALAGGKITVSQG